MSIASRKINDLNLAYNDLLQPLPEEVKFTEINPISVDSSPGSKVSQTNLSFRESMAERTSNTVPE